MCSWVFSVCLLSTFISHQHKECSLCLWLYQKLHLQVYEKLRSLSKGRKRHDSLCTLTMTWGSHPHENVPRPYRAKSTPFSMRCWPKLVSPASMNQSIFVIASERITKKSSTDWGTRQQDCFSPSLPSHAISLQSLGIPSWVHPHPSLCIHHLLKTSFIEL